MTKNLARRRRRRMNQSRLKTNDAANSAKIVRIRNAADPKLGREQLKREEEKVREWEDGRKKRRKKIEEEEEKEKKVILRGNNNEDDEQERVQEEQTKAKTSVVIPDLSNILKKAQEAAGLSLSEIPKPLFENEDIELGVWAALVDDKALKILTKSNERRMEEGVPAGSQLSTEKLSHAQGAVSLMTSLFGGNDQNSKDKDEKMTSSKAIDTIRIPFAGIKSLIIPNAGKVTNNGLLNLATSCTSLRRLNISGCKKVSDVALRALAKQNPKLEELDISDCPQIQGAGLVTVGECCNQIKILRLKRCPASEEWLLKRVATGVPDLRDIDLSFSFRVTDETLRTLAYRCNKLERINLAHCREISDVGVLSISEYCPGLEYLNLTRTHLKHKITDVCLLSLAERIYGLTTLILKGNELITDVGISWLASGCTAMEKLDLSECFKVSDGGLRAIGEGMAELSWLDISGLKHVSDIGIRNLASGCHKLRYLNCTDVYLLSDGTKRNFGVEGLQYLAGACKDLEHLLLDGCFQVGPKILKTFSEGVDPITELISCKLGHSMKTLSLRRLPNVKSSNIEYLLKGRCAESLVTLNLSECEGVRDKILSLVGKHAVHIRVLKVSKCINVTTRGVTAMCRGKNAKELQVLDLSYCNELNDLALLALSEAGFDPGLKKLNLKQCTHISETGLAWLSESISTLMEINLKGCEGVSVRGLKAIKGKWKYTLFRNDAEFFGIFPEEKCKDMRFIDEYGQVWKAAILIQNTYRAKVARRDAEKRREIRLMNWTARRLQSYWRGRVARRYAILKKLQRDREVEAAIKLQCAYRSRKAREIAEIEKEKAYKIKCEQAALFIQTRWRGKVSRDILEAAKRAHREYLQRCEASAIKMQRIWRGLEGRRKFEIHRTMYLAQKVKEEAAATRMQGLLRGRKARRELAAKRRLEEIEEKKKEQATLMLQKAARGRLARKKLNRKHEEEERRISAAIKLQCVWRSKKGALAVHLIRQARQRAQTENAALKVQATWRAKKGRMSAHMLKLARKQVEEEEQAAASKLQCMFRKRQANQKVKDLKFQKRDVLLRQRDLEDWAALLVQKTFRGIIGRRRARIYREEQMRKWKEMFDYEQDRVFWYSQITGEVRWRMPQDVLDLLPKPVCSNCGSNSREDDVDLQNKRAHGCKHSREKEREEGKSLDADADDDSDPPAEAVVECGTCSEYFCEICWKEVHRGGKRADHVYRALYDAYGKRVDYGDGEWPSIWMSEIEQDDVLGWQRIQRAEQAARGEAVTIGIPDLDPAMDRNKKLLRKGSKDEEKEQVLESESESESEEEEEDEEDGKEGKAGNMKGRIEDDNKDQEHLKRRWRKIWDYDEDQAVYVDQKRNKIRFDRPKSYESPREEDCWKHYHDETYDCWYYHNSKTGLSQYEKPACLLSKEEKQEMVVNSAWEKLFDESGKAFFHNANTGMSTFDRPAVYRTPREEGSSANLESNSSHWSRYHDDDSNEYYYNHLTHQTQYDRPPGYATPRGDVWRKYWDQEAEREYYHNEMTNESQYLRPEDFETPRIEGLEEGLNGWVKYPDPDSGMMVYENQETGDIQWERPIDFDVDYSDQHIPTGWERFFDDDGNPYYHNHDTFESTYERPDDYVEPPQPDDGEENQGDDLDALAAFDDFASGQALAQNVEPDDSWMHNEDWSVEGIASWLRIFKDEHDEVSELKTPPLAPDIRELVVDECDRLDLDSVTHGFGKIRSLLISRP